MQVNLSVSEDFLVAGYYFQIGELPITIKSHEGLNGQNVCEIVGSTPDKVYQVNLIADVIEEEYLEFSGVCG